jgi:hypothetical protein
MCCGGTLTCTFDVSVCGELEIVEPSLLFVELVIPKTWGCTVTRQLEPDLSRKSTQCLFPLKAQN